MREPIAQWLSRGDDFLLIAHVSPDGDTIGSCLALYGILSGMGKNTSICCDQPVPKVYRFLPWSEKIQLTEGFSGAYQNAVAVDCADISRMGYARALFDAARQKGNIDHHRTNAAFGDYIMHNGAASATGELVYALWRHLSKPVQKDDRARDIATCLFTAISTDTGNFAYSNTTPDTFRIAAELVEYGVDTAAVNREVFRSVSYERTLLKGHMLSGAELFEEGRISFAYLSLEEMNRFHATGEDVEGFIDYLRDIDTVEIAILLRGARDNTYKASMRSKQYADVSAVAREFGGGGHLRAAGCTLTCDWQACKRMLIEAACAAL